MFFTGLIGSYIVLRFASPLWPRPSTVLPHRYKALLIIGLVGFAVIKASLVALYFMHLKYEPKALGRIVSSTLILGCILVGVGMAEVLLPRP